MPGCGGGGKGNILLLRSCVSLGIVHRLSGKAGQGFLKGPCVFCLGTLSPTILIWQYLTSELVIQYVLLYEIFHPYGSHGIQHSEVHTLVPERQAETMYSSFDLFHCHVPETICILFKTNLCAISL